MPDSRTVRASQASAQKSKKIQAQSDLAFAALPEPSTARPPILRSERHLLRDPQSRAACQSRRAGKIAGEILGPEPRLAFGRIERRSRNDARLAEEIRPRGHIGNLAVIKLFANTFQHCDRMGCRSRIVAVQHFHGLG
jgi:hypothetical protein